jgi:hypothetical protein
MTLSVLSEEAQACVDVLPEQFGGIWRRGASVRPEVGLHVALLEQAMEDLRRPRRDRKRKHAYREALLWVASEDEKWPFSFLNVCACLGLDAEAVRSRLIGDGVSAQRH